MDKDKCRKIIEFFEAFHARPVLYTGKSFDFERTIQFIKGFYLALGITGESVPSGDEIRGAYSNRGWNNAYFGSIEEMKISGLDGDEITREIISVEIDVWKSFSSQFVGQCVE